MAHVETTFTADTFVLSVDGKPVVEWGAIDSMDRSARLYVYGVTDQHWEVSQFTCWTRVVELREKYPQAPFVYMWVTGKAGVTGSAAGSWRATAPSMNGWQPAVPPKDIEMLNMLLGE